MVKSQKISYLNLPFQKWMRVVHVWLKNSDHSLLHLDVKMVDEVEKVNLLFLLHLLLDLLLDILLNVQNLLLHVVGNV